MISRTVGSMFTAVCLALLFSTGAMATQWPPVFFHSADTSRNGGIELSELLRVVQFFNSDGYSCDPLGEDGFAPGPGVRDCQRHDSDYLDPEWEITLSELLRLIQFFNAQIYGFDPESEDGYRALFGPEDATATVQGDAESLRRAVDETADETLDPAGREELRDLLLAAEVLFVQDNLCGAADELDEALAFLQAGRESKSAEDRDGLDYLFARVRELQHRVLLTEEGGTTCPEREREGRVPDFILGESSAERVEVAASFGAARIRPGRYLLPDGEREAFSQLVIPGIPVESGVEGTPGVPCVSQLIAVPPGAAVTLFNDGLDVAETWFLKLAPFIEQPVDSESFPPEGPPIDREVFRDRPFVIDEEIYGTDAFFPEEPVSIFPLGTMRGLEVYALSICAGQYNPVSEELRLFGEMALRVEFSGGPNGFLPEFMASPFESNAPAYTGALLNANAVNTLPFIPELGIPEDLGEELLIFTHPDFLEAAERLAEWKQEKGILTNIFQGGTGSGIAGRETADEVREFFHDRYHSSQIRLSYVLLLGDAEFIPPHETPFLNPDLTPRDRTFGTDYLYSVDPAEFDVINEALLPSLAVGRLPVDTMEQADAVVDKIIAYESNPPNPFSNAAYYRRALLAGEFQCCRSDGDGFPGDYFGPGTTQRNFIETLESIRATLVARGYSAPRRYVRSVDAAYKEDPTPRRYFDGTPINPEIGPGSGFVWEAGWQDVKEVFDQGAVLALHRGHGNGPGWSLPSYSTFTPLTHSLLPVIFSINCLTGRFDNETAADPFYFQPNSTFWAERMLRAPGSGAVGLVAGQRLTPSWPNSALAIGIFDAMFPEQVPSFGSNARIRRLGDILNHGKLYMIVQIGTPLMLHARILENLNFFHVIGDPSLEIWLDPPMPAPNFDLGVNPSVGGVIELNFGTPELAGTTATLLQPNPTTGETVPVGRGIIAEDGTLSITAFAAWEPGEDVLVSLNRQGMASTRTAVRIPIE